MKNKKPATKEDLSNLDTKLTKQIKNVDTKLTKEIKKVDTRLTNKTERLVKDMRKVKKVLNLK